MLQVGLAWAEAYQVKHPEVLINVNGEGTGTGVTAMINGTTDFAQASRPFKDKEIADIVAKRGVAPMEHVVGFDGIAVYVHPSNPVKSLSIPQLKEIWAEGGSVDNWNQVGGPNLSALVAVTAQAPMASSSLPCVAKASNISRAPEHSQVRRPSCTSVRARQQASATVAWATRMIRSAGLR